MRKLSVFDDGARVATITDIGNGSILIFARTSRAWSEMKRLVDGSEGGPKDPAFLENVAARAHAFNYSTELVNE